MSRIKVAVGMVTRVSLLVSTTAFGSEVDTVVQKHNLVRLFVHLLL